MGIPRQLLILNRGSCAAAADMAFHSVIPDEQVGTARAVAALQRAAAKGQDAVAQVPLEAILNNSVDGLQVFCILMQSLRVLGLANMRKASTSVRCAGIRPPSAGAPVFASCVKVELSSACCTPPQAVRALIEKERKAAAAELAKLSSLHGDAAGSAAALPQGASPRATSEAFCFGVPADDFDSGAETDYGSGSCVTDLNCSSD